MAAGFGLRARKAKGALSILHFHQISDDLITPIFNTNSFFLVG
jgi:hypothetical protein